jgi:hypothetical protein
MQKYGDHSASSRVDTEACGMKAKRDTTASGEKIKHARRLTAAQPFYFGLDLGLFRHDVAVDLASKPPETQRLAYAAL